MDKCKLEKLVNEGKSIAKIAKEFDRCCGTITHWLKKYSLKTNGTKRTWSEEDMVSAINSSDSIAEALRTVGLTVRPGNYRTIKSFIKEKVIDISHMTGVKNMRNGKERKLDEVLVENSSYARNNLKRRLLKNGVLKNKCSNCGLDGEWDGKPIVMILDHINGVNDDHRIENLRMICPNCNSQTETFCMGTRKKFVNTCLDCQVKISRKSKRCKKCSGNNKAYGMRKVKDRPSKTELEKMINSMTWVAIGKKYNVSDNAVRKWARKCNII